MTPLMWGIAIVLGAIDLGVIVVGTVLVVRWTREEREAQELRHDIMARARAAVLTFKYNGDQR